MQYVKEQKVAATGNSLMLIITEPARLLGISAGDRVVVSVPDDMHIEITKKDK